MKCSAVWNTVVGVEGKMGIWEDGKGGMVVEGPWKGPGNHWERNSWGVPSAFQK